MSTRLILFPILLLLQFCVYGGVAAKTDKQFQAITQKYHLLSMEVVKATKYEFLNPLESFQILSSVFLEMGGSGSKEPHPHSGFAFILDPSFITAYGREVLFYERLRFHPRTEIPVIPVGYKGFELRYKKKKAAVETISVRYIYTVIYKYNFTDVLCFFTSQGSKPTATNHILQNDTIMRV